MTDKVTTEQMLELAEAVASDPWYYLVDCPSIGDGELKAVASALASRLLEHDALLLNLDTLEKMAETYRMAIVKLGDERDALKEDYEYKNEQLGAALLRAEKAEAEVERLTKRCEWFEQVNADWEGWAKKAEAELEAARPLLEAVNGDGTDPTSAKHPVVIDAWAACVIEAALAYREKKEGKK